MEGLHPTRAWTAFLFLSFAFLVAILLFLSPTHRWQPDRETIAPYGNDFLQEWVGGRLILEGKAAQLYNVAAFERTQHDPQVVGMRWSRAAYFPPVYPPPHYALATSLAWIPYRWAAIVWLVGLAAAMISGCWIAARYVVRLKKPAEERLSRCMIERWSCVAIVLFPASLYCLIVGQKGTLWLWLFAATWGLLRSRRQGLAGLVFGLLSIKPPLFFLLPIVMLRYGQWRFLLGASLSTAILWGATWLVLPTEVWVGFAEKLLMSSSYAGIQGYRLDWSCNLMSLAYLTNDPNRLFMMKWLFVLPLAIYGLVALVERKTFDCDHPRSLCLLLVVTFLLSPHAYYYDLVIFLIPLLWYGAIEPRRCMAYYLLMAAAIVISPSTLDFFGVPLIPIVLVGMLIELRLGITGRSSRTNNASASAFAPA